MNIVINLFFVAGTLFGNFTFGAQFAITDLSNNVKIQNIRIGRCIRYNYIVFMESYAIWYFIPICTGIHIIIGLFGYCPYACIYI